MKHRFLVIQLLSLPIFLFLLILTSRAAVAYDCSYGTQNGPSGWNENSRSVMVCFGGYSSPEEINGTVIQVQCLNNSNLVPGGICRGVTTDSTTLSGYTSSSNPNTNPAAGQGSDGLWYGCNTFMGINRAVGELQINITYSNGETCSTSPIITQPDDWDPLTEGMPWNKGTNELINTTKVLCADGVSVNTALGCIDVSSGSKLIETILRFATGIGGGLALALILYGVFIVTTSAGSPDKLKQGQEIITSAVIGLIFILLSVFLVNLIGINILGIPGLS